MNLSESEWWWSKKKKTKRRTHTVVPCTDPFGLHIFLQDTRHTIPRSFDLVLLTISREDSRYTHQHQHHHHVDLVVLQDQLYHWHRANMWCRCYLLDCPMQYLLHVRRTDLEDNPYCSCKWMNEWIIEVRQRWGGKRGRKNIYNKYRYQNCEKTYQSTIAVRIVWSL